MNMIIVIDLVQNRIVNELTFRKEILLPHIRPNGAEEPQKKGDGVEVWNDPHRSTRLSSRLFSFLLLIVPLLLLLLLLLP